MLGLATHIMIPCVESWTMQSTVGRGLLQLTLVLALPAAKVKDTAPAQSAGRSSVWAGVAPRSTKLTMPFLLDVGEEPGRVTLWRSRGSMAAALGQLLLCTLVAPNAELRDE